jgi:DNA-binding HxlR family transcriptional regulator
MRNSPTRFEQRVVTCLKEHGALGFSALRMATDAPNNPLLARTLARMRRAGRVVRHVHPTTPPTTSYTLPDRSMNDMQS